MPSKITLLNRLKVSKLSIDRSGAGESDQPSSSESCDRRTRDSHHEPSGVRTGQDHHGSVSTAYDQFVKIRA